MAHGDAREGKWRGNWRMEWVASTLHAILEHDVYRITIADAHTSATSSRLNWRPRQFKWTRPFHRKTKSVFCACAITFQTQTTCRKIGTWAFCCMLRCVTCVGDVKLQGERERMNDKERKHFTHWLRVPALFSGRKVAGTCSHTVCLHGEYEENYVYTNHPRVSCAKSGLFSTLICGPTFWIKMRLGLVWCFCSHSHTLPQSVRGVG